MGSLLRGVAGFLVVVALSAAGITGSRARAADESDDAPEKETKALAKAPKNLRRVPGFFENLLKTQIKKDREADSGKTTWESYVAGFVSEYLSDDVEDAQLAGNEVPLMGREREADALLDALVSVKRSIPLIVGGPGSGKSAVILRAAQKANLRDFPNEAAYRVALDEVVWICANGRKLAGYSMTDVVTGLREVQLKHGVRIILIIDDMHLLDANDLAALNEGIRLKQNPIRVVGTAVPDKFQLRFRDHEELQRRIQYIPIQELSNSEIEAILLERWTPLLEKRYRVSFSNPAVQAAVRLAPKLRPEAGRIDTAAEILQDYAVKALRQGREHKDALITLDDNGLYKSFSEILGYPANPADLTSIDQFMKGVRSRIDGEIFDQPRMIADTLELAQSVISGTRKGMGVGMIIGPSGTGKTELGKVIASALFGSPESFLRIDANEYKTGGLSLMKLFGAEGGIITSDTRLGVLPSFFDDPARGKYKGVVLIDEAERAHPDFWERLMEFLDTGSFVGGDGKRRYASQHLILITSNRGEKLLFPPNSQNWSDEQVDARVAHQSQDDLKGLFLQKTTGRDGLEVPGPVLNRVDMYTLSRPLTLQTARKIAQKEINSFVTETKERFGVELKFANHFDEALAGQAPKRDSGARPILLQHRKVLNAIRTQALSKQGAKRGSTVRIGFERDSGGTAFAVVGGVRIPMPSTTIVDPLQDPRITKQLEELPSKLRAHLIGQEAVVASVIEAITGHLGSPLEDRKPLSFFAVGLTGTGKTELGKAIAAALYGNKDRAAIIPLGDINTREKFNRIVGSDPGYVGSQDERLLEQALQGNPEGGVIVFDEASNMGGRDLGLKEELFKSLYQMLEEGVWTSSATGRTYDLSKYIFLFTGNDGEHLFRGVMADDLRMATWEHYRTRESVREMLAQNGVPPAFLGRMADLFLFKPLLRTEVKSITEQKIEPVLRTFRDRGFEVELEQGFVDKFSRLFFGPSTGARSLRTVTENRLRGLITGVLLGAKLPPELKNKGVKIQIGLRDLTPKEAFTRDGAPDPVVTLRVRVLNPDGSIRNSAEKDYTEFAALPKRLPVVEAIKTAYHEAGHAVANIPEISGERLRSVTILGDVGNLGYAHYEKLPQSKFTGYDRRNVLAKLVSLFGGQVAMVMAGYLPDSGWSKDLEMARRLATVYAKDWALTGSLAGVAVNKDGEPELTPAQNEQLARDIDALLIEAVTEAEAMLFERWGEVVLTVSELLRKGSLTGDDFDAIRNRVRLSMALSAASPRKIGSACAALLARNTK